MGKAARKGAHSDAVANASESELLRSIADRIPAMLAYWDTSLRCRYANPAYARWFGVAPGSLLGRHKRDLLGPALYARSVPYIERALRGETQEFERELPDPRGGPSSQCLTCYVPDLVDGAVRGLSVLVTDITAMKRAERALRESEERFRLTFDEAPIGMALVEPNGRFVRVNRALCEIVGYSAEELTGLDFQAITHPEDLDADLALVGRLARGEIQRYKLEKRYLRRDGAVVDVMLSVSVVRARDGAPTGYIAQIEDISERKRNERDQRFLAEAGPILASTLDYEETLTRVAELAVRDLADLCLVDLLDEDGVQHIRRAASRDPSKAWLCELLATLPLDPGRRTVLAAVLATRRPVMLHLPSEAMVAATAQNELHHHALRAADIRSVLAVPLLAHDRMLGVVTLVSSDRSRAYGPTDVRLAEELARRAALSIDNARLYRAARNATRARDEVLGVVAHDLRNPLHQILMQATLLQRTEPDGPVRRGVERIAGVATRMNRQIQELLDVTSLEAGRLSIEAEPVLAQRLFAECGEAMRPLADAASIELRVELPPDLPEIWADRDRLQVVVENLVGNALKFTPAGGRVTVGAEPREGEVLFRVTDTGRGISEGDLPHLFDRFWQARQGEGRGAGLGLAIVKGLVEVHGGRVWVVSTPGQGSTFSFTIPTAPRR